MADKLKNLLLAVLLLLMAGLLALTFFVSIRGSQGGSRLLQSGDEGESLQIPVNPSPAAQPEELAVFGPGGVFLARDGRTYSLLYQQVEPLWQETLGSATALEPVEAEVYLSLLQTPGILLQYHAAQPMYLLRAWSGSEVAAEDLEVAGLALVGVGEKVLLLVTDRQGGHWQAETAASYNELDSLCASVDAGNSQLAGEHAALPADQVLTVTVGSDSIVRASAADATPRGELSQNLLSLFGMNAYLTKVYPTADDSLVYVEGHSTVSLTPQGDLTYSGEGVELELTASDRAARQGEICRRVYDRMSLLWQQAGADGTLSLEDMQFEGDRGVLRFGLHLDGTYLERGEGYWATVTVENGRITGVTAALRQLETGESLQLLPTRQAAATLKGGRGVLRVRLLEQETGVFVPQVCFVTEE
ncbi:MAG: hypothetical protein IJA84_01520 [Clostridia bacterium]|nr:hypothetical protein [Clostridia bacterium]